MKKKETYKYYIKTKLDRESDLYKTSVKIKGDYFESLMFAVEEIITSLIENVGLNKEDFLKRMGETYDYIKEGNNENVE